MLAHHVVHAKCDGFRGFASCSWVFCVFPIVTQGESGARRLTRAFATLLVTVGLVVTPMASGWAAPSYSPCPAQRDVSSCDADGDSIPDTVERIVSGSATGATTRRRRSSSDGKNDPVRSFGIFNCRSPAVEVSNR